MAHTLENSRKKAALEFAKCLAGAFSIIALALLLWFGRESLAVVLAPVWGFLKQALETGLSVISIGVHYSPGGLALLSAGLLGASLCYLFKADEKGKPSSGTKEINNLVKKSAG